MKFSKVLLLFAATLTLTLANNLEVSELEDGAGANGLDADFGDSSDQELNSAPIESAPSLPPKNVPSTTPSTSTSLPPKMPPKNLPTSGSSTAPTKEPPSSLPPKNVPSESAPLDNIPGFDSIPIEEDAGSIPEDVGSVPENAGISGNNIDDAEKSGDEDKVPNEIDNVNAANGQAVDSGEKSDDYGDDQAVNNLDNADANENSDAGNANGITEGNVEADDGLVENKDDSSSTTKIAAGLCGAAAVSSAGIFFWVKRSKQKGYVQSVRTQISMV